MRRRRRPREVLAESCAWISPWWLWCRDASFGVAAASRERHFCDDRWSGHVPSSMRRWELSVALDPACEQPLFLQLASAIADDIRRGRLKPGEPLPGTRELAERLELNRNTIVAGYDELAAEGLVSTRVGGGTFVAEALPASMRAPDPNAGVPTFDV